MLGNVNILHILPLAITIAGGLIMFGWIKKTISSNEKEIHELKKQKPVTQEDCKDTQDKLIQAIYKLDEKLDKKSDVLHKEIQENKTIVTSQFITVVKALGRLEGILNGKA